MHKVQTKIKLRGIVTFYVRYSTLLHLLPLRFVSEDAGIEPGTVGTWALVTARLDLIHYIYNLNKPILFFPFKGIVK